MLRRSEKLTWRTFLLLAAGIALPLVVALITVPLTLSLTAGGEIRGYIFRFQTRGGTQLYTDSTSPYTVSEASTTQFGLTFSLIIAAVALVIVLLAIARPVVIIAGLIQAFFLFTGSLNKAIYALADGAEWGWYATLLASAAIVAGVVALVVAAAKKRAAAPESGAPVA
jgi:hypothetical protein